MEFNGDAATTFLSVGCEGNVQGWVSPRNGETKPMTKLKTLSAIAVLTTAIASPVFAQDAGVFAPADYGRAYDQRNFRGAYNQLNAPYDAIPRTEGERNIEDFGFSGRDPSRPGGYDPSLKPSGS